MATLLEEPGIQVTPQITDDGLRLLIKPLVCAPNGGYERGCDRLTAHGLPLRGEVLYLTREEWRLQLDLALEEVHKREEAALQTAEHTTPNLPREGIYNRCGSRIRKTVDGRDIGWAEATEAPAVVPNTRLPPPQLYVLPTVEGIDGEPVAIGPLEGSA